MAYFTTSFIFLYCMLAAMALFMRAIITLPIEIIIVILFLSVFGAMGWTNYCHKRRG